MAVAAEHGPGGADLQVLVNLSLRIDAQQRAAAKEDFAVAPGRPFGIARRRGIMLELDTGQPSSQFTVRLTARFAARRVSAVDATEAIMNIVKVEIALRDIVSSSRVG